MQEPSHALVPLLFGLQGERRGNPPSPTFARCFQDVCCVACLSVDIHREHSEQVKSVVDVANVEREALGKHLERVQRLNVAFNDEQQQLEQALRSEQMMSASKVSAQRSILFLQMWKSTRTKG